MKAPASCEAFLQLVRKSRLVDPASLDDYARRLDAARALPGDPRDLASLMVRQGRLSYFQATQLLRGKHRGFILGSYVLLERLGSGRSRLVFLAVDLVLRRRLALEVGPRFPRGAPPGGPAPEFGIGDLDHLNLVRAYGTERVEGLTLRLWEYVDGASLRDIVQERGPLEVLRAAHYVRQAAEGLEHILKAGLIHGRINPGNLLLDRRGTVKILESGGPHSAAVSGTARNRAANDRAIIITPAYGAPEGPLDIRSDIYSLGATFFFLLTARLPCAEDLAIPGAGSNPDVPEPIRAILAQMMAEEPGRRFATPADVVGALADCTRAPILPPAEDELPKLSPLARRAWSPVFQRIRASCSFPTSPGGYGPGVPPAKQTSRSGPIDKAAAAETLIDGTPAADTAMHGAVAQAVAPPSATKT